MQISDATTTLNLTSVTGTGEFQVCNVGIQRILKHILRAEATKFLVEEVRAQVDRGVAAESIVLHPDLATLRNASCGWVLKAYLHFKERPELVLKVRVMMLSTAHPNGLTD